MRPVNTDNPGFGVTATISKQGSFLLAGAGWYPELVDSQATYKLTVTAPSGLIAVTAGRSLGHKISAEKPYRMGGKLSRRGPIPFGCPVFG